MLSRTSISLAGFPRKNGSVDLDKISDLLKRLSEFLSGDDSPTKLGKPRIEIRGRNNSSTQQQLTSSNPPRINILGINLRRPNESETNPYGDIGGGITLRKHRKPSRCSVCATKGKVVANVRGPDRWRCEECGCTFN